MGSRAVPAWSYRTAKLAAGWEPGDERSESQIEGLAAGGSPAFVQSWPSPVAQPWRSPRRRRTRTLSPHTRAIELGSPSSKRRIDFGPVVYWATRSAAKAAPSGPSEIQAARLRRRAT